MERRAWTERMVLEQFVGHDSQDACPIIITEMNRINQLQQLIQQIRS